MRVVSCKLVGYFLCCILFLTSCTSSQHSSTDGAVNQQLIKNRFSHITEAPSPEFNRLVQRWCREINQRCTLMILNSDEPMALSPYPSTIYISKGLLEIATMHSDSIYFIVTHELAHTALGHFSHQAEQLSELEREQSADAYALMMLYKKAKDFSELPEFLSHLSNSHQLSAEGRELLQQRIEHLRHLVTTLHQRR